jgi:DNA repair exonuclease SbcCD ATPase subunit
MKIRSIRLHPFGATRDRTYTFAKGVNVLEGPNEAGKSTLCNALFHALFTPSKLTPTKFRDVMKRFVPLPDGDHAHVTLVFDHECIEHTLIRTWGAGANSLLVRSGSPDLVDGGEIDTIVQKALRWNQATWEHVLFINQAKLSSTLDLLHASGSDDVGEILRASGSIDGDIAPEKLIAALEVRIDSLYSNWDRQLARPRDGRGIANPHKQKVGPVLKAYYAQENTRQEYERVLQHEKDVDAVNAEIARVQQLIEKEKPLVEDGRTRKEGLNRRAILEQNLKHGQAEIARLMKVMTEWPGAEQVLKEKKDALLQCAQQLERLATEIANAKLHEGAEKVRSGHHVLTEAKKALDEARTEFAALKPVSKEQIDEIRKLAQRMERIEVEIKAQKLAAVLQAKEPMTVTIERGGSEKEEIALSTNTPYQFSAEGRVSISAGALQIHVRSDQKDVEQLYVDLESARQQLQRALMDLEAADLPTLIARKENHDLAQQKVDRANATYVASLQKKTEDQWQKAIDDLKSIPPTRSLTELEQEHRRILADQARHEQEKKTLEKNLTEWTNTFTSVDLLTMKVVDLRGAILKDGSELASLPMVPEGYPDANAYLLALKKAEDAFERAKDQLQQAQLKLSNLEGRTPSTSLEELKEQLELSEREFDRTLNEAKAYERILVRVLALADREGPDPLAGLAKRVEHFVHLLTDGRYKPQLDGVKATGLLGRHELEKRLLSQGTKGCLALAIRMAYAEIYLGESEGFMIMDDPLTDMDPARRRCAVKAIKDFAEKYQVIVLTCHPEHAALFQEAGAFHQSLVAKEAVA